MTSRGIQILALLPLELFTLNGAGGALPAATPVVWKQLGPFGGPAEYVVTSPSTPNLLLAGTPNAMLYRSPDAGATWTHLSFPAELAASLHVILPHPFDANRILAGVSPDTGGSGLFLSVDGGETWQSVAAFNGRDVWALAHFPPDPRVIVAGASDGVYESTDAGANWRLISGGQSGDLKPVVSVAIHPGRREIIYAGTSHLPWKTADGGRTWQSIHSGMLDDSDVFSIDIDRREPSRVVASACSGIYRSLNAGALWTKLRGSPDASFRTYVIAHDPHVPAAVWAGTTHGLMRSADGGATWHTVSPHSVKSIAFDPHRAGTIYLATRDAGMLKSADGAAFAPINRGFVNRSFFGFAANGESLWLSGEGLGILESANGGLDWKSSTAHDRILMMSSCRDNSALFAGGPGFLRQLLAGQWLPLTEPRREAVRSVACEGARLFAVSSRSAYLSPDAGRTWTNLATPDPAMEWNQIAAAGGALLAATSQGLLRSTDGGRTWPVVSGDLGQATVTSILSHPEQPGRVFAAQYDRLFLSTDNGLEWAPLASRGLERAAVRALAVVKSKPGRLYALAAGRGVFVTDLE